jgi:hypothetical protein
MGLSKSDIGTAVNLMARLTAMMEQDCRELIQKAEDSGDPERFRAAQKVKISLNEMNSSMKKIERHSNL